MSYPKFPVDGKSHSKPIKLADPVEVLIARCQARAHLVAAGDLALIESVDALQIAAERTDLLWLVGQDAVQAIMANAFQTFCPVPPTTPEVCVAVTQTSPAPASDEANPDDDLAGLSASFVRACRLATLRGDQCRRRRPARWSVSMAFQAQARCRGFMRPRWRPIGRGMGRRPRCGN